MDVSRGSPRPFALPPDRPRTPAFQAFQLIARSCEEYTECLGLDPHV
jgi:hypothetical protein